MTTFTAFLRAISRVALPGCVVVLGAVHLVPAVPRSYDVQLAYTGYAGENPAEPPTLPGSVNHDCLP